MRHAAIDRRNPPSDPQTSEPGRHRLRAVTVASGAIAQTDYALKAGQVQAINYAAMVSRLMPEDVAELYAAACRRDREGADAASALARSLRAGRIVVDGAGLLRQLAEIAVRKRGCYW